MDVLDLFLLIGQSNMVGRASIEPQDQIPDPRLWMFTYDSRWAPAIDPLHFDNIKAAGTGLGRTFGKTVLAADPEISIGLIPSAVGGTSIDQWRPGDELYNIAIAQTRAAIKRGRIRAVLWHQGESDCAPNQIQTYLAKLTRLIAALRTDLVSPDLPFIAGQIGDFSPSATEFNDQLLKLPQLVAHTACVRSAGLTSLGDNTHFDSASLRELGKRYAIEYFKLIDRSASQFNGANAI